jgi:hypothetical protein
MAERYKTRNLRIPTVYISTYTVGIPSMRERNHWGDPDVDGRIILRWIFKKWEEVVGTGWSGLRIGIGGGHLLLL